MATEERIDALLDALAEATIDFIVIGGVAVGWHGFIRATKDIDVVPDPHPDNLRRLAALLTEIGAAVDASDDFDLGELPDPTDAEVLGLGGNWVLQTTWTFGHTSNPEQYAADSTTGRCGCVPMKT